MMVMNGPIKTPFITSALHHICPSLQMNLSSIYPGENTSLPEQTSPSVLPVFFSRTQFSSPLDPHLTVRLGLLPLHLAELGLESFVLIGQHLEAVLQAGSLLLVAANQLAVDLVLQ